VEAAPHGKFKAESFVEKVSVLKSVRINDEFNRVSIAFKVHTWSFVQTCSGKQGRPFVLREPEFDLFGPSEV
jgi:hypothetical protein